jgi:cyclophilin family peptidyl-prolyl cis-trans isomerase
MKRLAIALAALPLLAAAPADQKAALAPSEIVAASPATDWVRIAPEDLMVMELAPDPKGRGRRVVIQLMPPPFSQGWVGNIRKLVAARWYDGVSVNRVQDNYVAQWGDADGEDPKKAKKLPAGLATPSESEYGVYMREMDDPMSLHLKAIADVIEASRGEADAKGRWTIHYWGRDAYARMAGHINGWQVAADSGSVLWPVHCYGMVGVGRGMSPDTGSGAELYTVIGHAPRHLDRNIALVGRVIEGIEHLSSLPRGTEALGFYKTAEERTPISSVRLGHEVKDLPAYEFLSTETRSFAAYADARANRRDAFFNVPAGGADICNVPVPVRRAKG